MKRRDRRARSEAHPAFDPSPSEAAAERAARERERHAPRAARLRAGTVHTPAWLARAVAGAADALLRDELGLDAGIADAALGIVDPACGPGVFLASALALGEGRGSHPACVLGLDRDAGALALAGHALGPGYERAGWPLALEATDTTRALEPAALAARAPAWLVLGNPPWIASAQAKPPPWLVALLDDFRCDVDGAPLRERKSGVLADAYVRFLRWSAEVARRSERGAVLALVTSGAYLDGPVHRGLRGALLRWFHALHVVDLGGSALLARARGAERDDNVFGVRPNVALLFAARRAGHDERALGLVHYRRLAGTLAHKAAALATLTLGASTGAGEPTALAPHGPLQRFVPAPAPCEEYARGPSLAELFPFHREGVQTNRDAVAVDADRDRLLARLHDFARGRRTEALAAALRAKPHYDPALARRALAVALEAHPDGRPLIRPLAYRPFDCRWFVTVPPLCHRPRPELLAAMDRSAFALVSARKDRSALPWACFGAAREVIDNCWLSTRSSCRARAFPTHTPEGAQNLDLAAAAPFAERLGELPSVEALLLYALACLASPRYRRAHDAALKADYARIPLPSDRAAFEARRALGEQLLAVFGALGLDERGRDAGVRAPGSGIYVGHHELGGGAWSGIAGRAAVLGDLLRACDEADASTAEA